MPWSDMDIMMLLRAKDKAADAVAALERSFLTLRMAIEREGFDVMHDVADFSYSVRKKSTP